MYSSALLLSFNLVLEDQGFGEDKDQCDDGIGLYPSSQDGLGPVEVSLSGLEASQTQDQREVFGVELRIPSRSRARAAAASGFCSLATAAVSSTSGSSGASFRACSMSFGAADGKNSFAYRQR